MRQIDIFHDQLYAHASSCTRTEEDKAMSGTRSFRKYGEIFEDNEGIPVEPVEPESPYEGKPYVAPDKRGKTPVEAEQDELRDLRPAADNHYD